MQTAVVEPVIAEPGRAAVFFDTAPNSPFHVCLGVAVLAWIWALSVPGGYFLPLIMSGFALTVLAGYWLVRLLVWGLRSSRVSSRRWLWVAPFFALWVLVPTTDASLRARFAFAESDFAAIVDSAELDSTASLLQSVEVPGRVGSYSISRAFSIGENVFFRENNGGFLDSVGFAYLPNGPDNPVLVDSRSYEFLPFEELSGDWYVWTSPF